MTAMNIQMSNIELFLSGLAIVYLFYSFLTSPDPDFSVGIIQTPEHSFDRQFGTRVLKSLAKTAILFAAIYYISLLIGGEKVGIILSIGAILWSISLFRNNTHYYPITGFVSGVCSAYLLIIIYGRESIIVFIYNAIEWYFVNQVAVISSLLTLITAIFAYLGWVETMHSSRWEIQSGIKEQLRNLGIRFRNSDLNGGIEVKTVNLVRPKKSYIPGYQSSGLVQVIFEMSGGVDYDESYVTKMLKNSELIVDAQLHGPENSIMVKSTSPAEIEAALFQYLSAIEEKSSDDTVDSSIGTREIQFVEYFGAGSLLSEISNFKIQSKLSFLRVYPTISIWNKPWVPTHTLRVRSSASDEFYSRQRQGRESIETALEDLLLSGNLKIDEVDSLDGSEPTSYAVLRYGEAAPSAQDLCPNLPLTKTELWMLPFMTRNVSWKSNISVDSGFVIPLDSISKKKNERISSSAPVYLNQIGLRKSRLIAYYQIGNSEKYVKVRFNSESEASLWLISEEKIESDIVTVWTRN